MAAYEDLANSTPETAADPLYAPNDPCPTAWQEELPNAFHDRVYAALAQASCVEGGAATTGSFGWPSKDLVLRGHLFDTGLINQALDIIETSGGDLELSNLNVSPNDQFNTEFNFKRPSSVDIRVFGVDDDAVAAIVARLHSLVEVMDKAEGSLTEV